MYGAWSGQTFLCMMWSEFPDITFLFNMRCIVAVRIQKGNNLREFRKLDKSFWMCFNECEVWMGVGVHLMKEKSFEEVVR